jgi:hypothetical protein
MSLVCDALADASDCMDAVDAASADDNEVNGARALNEGGNRMRGIPGVYPVSPGGSTLDRFAAGGGDHLERTAESGRELFGRHINLPSLLLRPYQPKDTLEQRGEAVPAFAATHTRGKLSLTSRSRFGVTARGRSRARDARRGTPPRRS